MLIYNELKNHPREFLAATGLKLDEFEQLLPAFQTAYEQKGGVSKVEMATFTLPVQRHTGSRTSH
jgi:hypothetical protein